jgi:type I restriction enzyme, S subunit
MNSDLPSHWIWSEVGSVANNIQPGFARQPNESTDGCLQLRMPSISRSGFIDYKVSKYVDATDEEKIKYAVQRGDVIFNNTNSPELVGNAAYFDDDIECVLSNHMTRIRVDSRIVLPSYLATVFHHYWKTGQTQRRSKQWINQAAVDIGTLSRFRIPLPPLSEQQQIVEIIQEAEEVRRLRAVAGAKTAELIPAMFHAHFVNDKNGDFQPLHKLADIVSGVAVGRKTKGMTSEVAYLRVANVQAGYIDLGEIKTTLATDGEIAQYALKDGDVLLTEGGDFDKLGRGALWEGQVEPCIHQNHVFRVRPKAGKLHSRFFAHYLQSAKAKNYFLRCAKKTTNLASINLTQLMALPVPNIPLDDQVAFEVEIELASQCLPKEADKAFFALTASLSAHAFSGRLTAAWRDANGKMLAVEAQNRDKELALLSGKTVLVNFSSADPSEDADAFDIPTDLNREQLALLFNMKAMRNRKELPRYFTSEFLAEQINGPLHRHPQAIESHLSVFAVRGLIIPVSRRRKDANGNPFAGCYRLSPVARQRRISTVEDDEEPTNLPNDDVRGELMKIQRRLATGVI